MERVEGREYDKILGEGRERKDFKCRKGEKRRRKREKRRRKREKRF